MKQSVLKGSHPAGTEYAEVGDAEVAWTFGDPRREYRSLRESAGLTDLSGLGVIRVSGADATPLLQQALSRDVGYMTPERSVGGLLLSDTGSPLDLLIVYKVSGGFVVETSVGRGTATIATLAELASSAAMTVEIADLSSDQIIVGVEGPKAWLVGMQALGVEVNGLPFEGAMQASFGGAEVMISRTGFTGEFGFKVFAPVAASAALWNACAESATPAGYEALEMTMLEVRHPRLHREIVDGASAITCGLNWLIDMDKPEFVGRAALEDQSDGRPGKLCVGFGGDPGITAEAGSGVFAGDLKIGTVIDRITSPLGDHSLGLALVDADFVASGLTLSVADASGQVPVQTLSAPYRVPTSWRAVRGQ